MTLHTPLINYSPANIIHIIISETVEIIVHFLVCIQHPSICLTYRLNLNNVRRNRWCFHFPCNPHYINRCHYVHLLPRPTDRHRHNRKGTAGLEKTAAAAAVDTSPWQKNGFLVPTDVHSSLISLSSSSTPFNGQRTPRCDVTLYI